MLAWVLLGVGVLRERVVPRLQLLDKEANLNDELVSGRAVILPIIECTYQAEVELVNLHGNKKI